MQRFTREEIAARGHPVWAEVDLAAIRHNIGVLAETAGEAEVMGVVKGYAYGHGNPACAETMLEAGATRLGVARVAEALHLRDAGIGAPIHVFTEPPPEAARTMVEHGLVATVYTQRFARLLSDAAAEAERSVAVHVKLDTGMHRVGVPPDAVADAVREMAGLPGLEIEGAWSHFAVADIPEHPFNKEQLDLFERLLEVVASTGLRLRYRHLANSAATLSSPEAHYDIVRPGVASYGLWPSDALAGALDLRPALALKARINMTKEVPAGDALSYGLKYRLERPGRVVTIPAGYADGYDRRLSGRGDVLVGGRRYRVSGTVCMDQFMVDVGDAATAIGDVATLIGDDGDERIGAEELAALVGTINYEITSRIPSRVPRIYHEGGSPT